MQRDGTDRLTHDERRFGPAAVGSLTQRQQVGPDLYRVAVGERDAVARRQTPAVQERAVAAAEIFDEVLAAVGQDLRMLPAHLFAGEADVAVCLSAQGGSFRLQREVPAHFW